MTLHWWSNKGPVTESEIIIFPNGLQTFRLWGPICGRSRCALLDNKRYIYISCITFSTTATGPMLSHQWRVIKVRPGPSSRRRGPKKRAQTMYFKRFWTFLGVQKRGAAGRTDGRTHARTHGRTDASSAPDPPPQRMQEKNTPFGAGPPHSDIHLYYNMYILCHIYIYMIYMI